MTKAVHSVAQPIVCCIGTSVAGQATQFLFERTLVSQGSDWRAISVEVPADRFKTACEGMLAMHFQGLRLFGDFQTAAVSELAADSRAAQFVGKLTSGVQQHDHWHCWDSVGYAWIDVLQRSAGEMPCMVWLHADSRTTRSAFVALSMLAGNSPQWLWTQAPEVQAEATWQKSLSGWYAEGRIQPQMDMAICLKLLAQWLIDPEKNKSTKLAIISEEGALPEELPKVLMGLPIELIAPASLKLPEALAHLPVHRVGSAELAVAGEAYDFQRWTGKLVDIQLLQDAYDEYCDF